MSGIAGAKKNSRPGEPAVEKSLDCTVVPFLTTLVCSCLGSNPVPPHLVADTLPNVLPRPLEIIGVSHHNINRLMHHTKVHISMNQSRTNGPLNAHLTIAQVYPGHNNENQEALL